MHEPAHRFAVAADRYPGAQVGFARHGKDDITIHQMLTHQAGFPNVPFMPPEA